MPDFAFLLWSSFKSNNKSQIALKEKMTGHYHVFYVVCACCPSEQYGITPPNDETQKSQWERTLSSQFKQVVAETCKANGISTIFLRNASAWGNNYGDVTQLSVVEACNHRAAYLRQYGRDVVNDSLRFIDPLFSRGMSNDNPFLASHEYQSGGHLLIGVS